jgi:hypothetical protein
MMTMHRNDEALDSVPGQVNTMSAALSVSHAAAALDEPPRLSRKTAPRPRGFRLDKTYYPLGFPVRVQSNTPLVLAAAERSWHASTPLFDRPPLRVEFKVDPDDGLVRTLPSTPQHELKDDKLFVTAGPENVLVADLKRGRAAGRVAECSVRCQRYFRYHFLEGAALSLISTQYCVPIHAACIEWEGRGMLLCGDSGAGKSTLAFASARSGCTYVSDDASYLVLGVNDRLVAGNCHSVRFRPSAQELFPEIAGRPVTPRAVGKPSIEVATATWPWVRTAPTAHVSFLVFLNRKWTGNQELVVAQADHVRAWFTSSLLPLKHLAERQDAALDHLLTCRAVEMRYHDLNWAIERLKRLARDGV